MVAQFPEVVNTPAASLTPKISFSIVTQDLSSAAFYQDTVRRARIAEVKIHVTNIEKSLIASSISRIFEHIYYTIISDINPDISSATDTIHSGDGNLLGSASVSLTINVNKTNIPYVVDFDLAISNLKSEYVDDTFSRIKNYLLNAVDIDMNAS